MTIPHQTITRNPRSTLEWMLDLSAWLQADTIEGTPTVAVLQGDAIVFSVAANPAAVYVPEDAGCATRRVPALSAIIFWVTSGTIDSVARISFATKSGRIEDVTVNIKLSA